MLSGYPPPKVGPLQRDHLWDPIFGLTLWYGILSAHCATNLGKLWCWESSPWGEDTPRSPTFKKKYRKRFFNSLKSTHKKNKAGEQPCGALQQRSEVLPRGQPPRDRGAADVELRRLPRLVCGCELVVSGARAQRGG